MKIQKLNNFQIDKYIIAALKEDITFDDLSTSAIYREDKTAKISLLSKDKGILAGLDVFKRVFSINDPLVDFIEYKKDGDKITNGELVMEIIGNVRTILTSERVALNFLQRMSGIATQTKKYVEALGDENIKILDTRKTTPNLRLFEKYSVKVGGGFNHRYNLSDGIMLKDNHIGAAGSVKKAIEMAREYAPFVKKIEIEVEDLEMLKEAVDAKADIIMLDNMDIDMVKKAIEIIDKKAIIECSGNINIDNISRYRGMQIDYISSGSLTNNANIVDLSMKNLRYVD
ncbi:carboxylating nicotinate-nucleotide diphosphorylase [Peptostreptococcus canis]|uniref:nicotinate-nucleotide diphosphorylase (carboxylating) n=1 Tax=Peptostreptococcus canis TaxID=1159213 RepID=A0ABR6TID4_9FIRM|nr:carboxylating nicotinate-nucleotide diphosphorylase [Peptostreptococcus canis]MBC2575157.1 carboxylating nicotinate-nucleotide diphosphorylase [Peptostreptococcus canis]MBP1997669.1 nicotinate-nucleotide pyrophosphorylase (carboxylating) [Peptostreptococcus canis]